MNKIRSYIKGVGHNVPDRVVTNDELSKLMDTTDQWIVERTGIKERRFADLQEAKGVGREQSAQGGCICVHARKGCRQESRGDSQCSK